MMKKLLLAFVIYHSALTIGAAQNLDSLWEVWQDVALSDSTRLRALDKFTRDGYLFTQPDSAYYLGQLQYEFATSKNENYYVSAALNIIGLSYYFKDNYLKALEYHHQALSVSEEIGNKELMSRSLIELGMIYSNQGKASLSLENNQKCLEICEELGNKKLASYALNNIGMIYYDQNNYLKALEYHQKSLAIKEEMGNQRGVAVSLNQIGNIYLAQGNYSQALENYQRGLEIAEKGGHNNEKAWSINNIGRVHYDQGHYSLALENFKKSLAIREELGNRQEISSSFNTIGWAYYNEGNYPLALQNCKRGFELVNGMGVLGTQKSACQCLYFTYKALHNNGKALLYLEKMNVIEDSMQVEETSKKLQQMEFAKQVYQDSVETFENERLVQEAHEAEMRQKEVTRNLALGGGLFVLLLAGGIYSRLRYVRKSKAALQVEKERSDNLLLNILPEEIAQELKEKGKADARDFEMVSILFTDFRGFTEQSAKLSAQDLVSEINTCFEAFDGIMEKYGIEKIKTIGDAYMAAGGLPVPTDDSVKNTVLAALEMQRFIEERKKTKEASGESAFEMRVGIHTGPVVAGIVGVKKFQYDIWGDTVNTASRMESSGEVGKVNISQATYEHLKNDPQFTFESRGKIEAKGKGEMEMWFVSLAK